MVYGVLMYPFLLLEDLPLSKMQRLAKHMKDSKPAQRFARIGAKGKHKQNMNRDLLSLLRQLQSVEPTLIKLPIRTKAGKVIPEKLWPVVAPHEFLFYLHKRGDLSKVMVGTVSLDEFWPKFFEEPGMQKLAAAFGHVRHSDLYPVRIHGDKGKFHNGKNVLILSASGLCHHSNPFLGRLVLSVFPGNRFHHGKRQLPGYDRGGGAKKIKKRWLKTNATLVNVSKFLKWSLEAAEKGVFPSEPFARPLSFVFLFSLMC